MIKMSDYTKEQFDELPEFSKKDYVEVDGAYKHIATQTIKKTANELDVKLKASQLESAQARERLASSDALKEEEKARAIEEALELAKKENNHELAFKLEREQMADQLRVLELKQSEFGEKQQAQADTEKTNLAAKLAFKGATQDGSELFNMTIKNYIDIDKESGKRTFLNFDGSASSIEDEDLFIGYLKTWDIFKPIMKGLAPMQNGGNVNGSLDGSADGKSFKDMNGAERLALKNKDPAAFAAAVKLL